MKTAIADLDLESAATLSGTAAAMDGRMMAEIWKQAVNDYCHGTRSRSILRRPEPCRVWVLQRRSTAFD